MTGQSPYFRATLCCSKLLWFKSSKMDAALMNPNAAVLVCQSTCVVRVNVHLHF